MRRFTRWIIGTAVLLIAGGAIYSAGYYYVTAEWPWQADASTTSVILAQARTQHPHGIASPTGQPPADSSTLMSTPTQEITASSIATGTVEQGTIHSAFLPGDQPFLIYLPPGYNDPANLHMRYPSAYLLHGAPGNYLDWNAGGSASATADALIAAGRIPPMILVMPEGVCSLTQDSEWVDSPQTHLRAESYIVKEVLPYIDAHYRTIANPADRTIGGLSSGGYGGVNTAFHHPELFTNAFGISGDYHASKTIIGKTLFTDQAAAAYNSPALYVAHVANPQQFHIYLAVGKQDKLDNALRETQTMEQALKNAQVPHQVDYDDGAHSWHFWSLHLVNALAYFADTLAAQ